MTTECVIIHGAWHVPAHYQLLVKNLEQEGLRTHCPELPSSNNDVPPTKTFEDDCKTIRDLVLELCKQNIKILCVMHSYGGVVGTNALKGLSWAQRQQAGLPGGVSHLICICSFLLPVDASLVSALGGQPPHIQENDNGTCTMLDAGDRFYNDLAENDRRKWVEALVTSPTSTHKTPISYAAYKDIPSTYILTEDDHAIPPEAQQMMVKAAQESGAVVDLKTLPSGHSPFLSMADRVAALVLEIKASGAP